MAVEELVVPSVKQLFDLTDKVAIVTGASSGLGAVFATALAQAGADVVLAARRKSGLERTARQVREAGRTVPTDVTVADQVDNLVGRTVDQFGRIDILVNNAGVATVAPAEVEPLEDFKWVIDVNLTSVFLVAQRVARQMLRNGGGKIINIASIYGAVGSSNVPATAYAAAKGGVINLTRELAIQWARRGINVNAIGPAFFPSEMTAGIFADASLYGNIVANTPMGRTGRPEDIAGVVVFLASSAANYITGQTIFVDGGWLAW